jgi:hypothetical protein
LGQRGIGAGQIRPADNAGVLHEVPIRSR